MQLEGVRDTKKITAHQKGTYPNRKKGGQSFNNSLILAHPARSAGRNFSRCICCGLAQCRQFSRYEIPESDIRDIVDVKGHASKRERERDNYQSKLSNI